VFLTYTPEQEALRDELRAYFAELLTPEVRAGLGGPGEGGTVWRETVRKMGQDGWLGIGWPTEYAGPSRTSSSSSTRCSGPGRPSRS
jgi:alkylation response protein AidB-like acyl-CoA dehydrogenase